ncbi:MAG: M3 family oligoendopeptidase [Candidatus Woesearchaeota archaeon]
MPNWNLSDILEKKSPQEIINNIKRDVEKFKNYRSVLDSADDMLVLEIIDLKEKITYQMMQVEGYYSLIFYANTKDSDAISNLTMLKQLNTELSNEMMFFALWIMNVDEKKYSIIIGSEKLKKYKQYLKKVRILKPHTLTEENERIINIKNISSGSFFDIYEIMTNGFTFKFQGRDSLLEDVTKNYRSNNPALRQKAYETVLSKYKERSSELAEIYKNIVLDWDNEDMQLRKYAKPISSRNLSNEIADKTVDILLKVIRKNISIFQEYFKLKYKIIGKTRNTKKYEYSRYHLYAPYNVKLPKYDYETSKKMVLEMFKSFDARMHTAAKSIIDAKHIDTHPRKNKRGGAFCSNITNKHLPYIMLNHTDELGDVFTLAHELGHGIHDVLSQEQPNLLQHPSLPMCETASIFSEMLLTQKMFSEIKNVDQKKYLLMRKIDDEYASIVRQAYFVLFEIYAHDNISKGIKKEDLDEYYYSLLKEQFGDMKIPEFFKYEWNYIPHIHEYPFYCYAYAFGNLLVLSLYNIYLNEGEQFKEKYVKMLRYGGSKSPFEILEEIGININTEEFWQQGFDIIRKQVDELKKLL